MQWWHVGMAKDFVTEVDCSFCQNDKRPVSCQCRVQWVQDVRYNNGFAIDSSNMITGGSSSIMYPSQKLKAVVESLSVCLFSVAVVIVVSCHHRWWCQNGWWLTAYHPLNLHPAIWMGYLLVTFNCKSNLKLKIKIESKRYFHFFDWKVTTLSQRTVSSLSSRPHPLTPRLQSKKINPWSVVGARHHSLCGQPSAPVGQSKPYRPRQLIIRSASAAAVIEAI